MNPIISMCLLNRRYGMRAPYREVAGRAALFVVAIYLGLAIFSTLAGFSFDMTTEIEPTFASTSPAELMFDWIWGRTGISFESIFRSNAVTKTLDWVVESGLLF